MKTRKTNPGGTTTPPQTSHPPKIPPKLKKRIDAYYNQEAERLRELFTRHDVPEEITDRVLADLADTLYNTYDGLHVAVADIMILGTRDEDLEEAYKTEYCTLFTPPILAALFHDYSLLAAAVRLERQAMAADPQVQPWYREMQERKKIAGGPFVAYELARHYGTQPRVEDRLGAIATRYGGFIINAAVLFKATATELLTMPTPDALDTLGLPEDDLAKIKDTLVSEIISVSAFTLEHLQQHPELFGGKEIPKPLDEEQAKRYNKIIHQKREPAPAADPGEVIRETATTMADKVVTFYQSITATLSKPIEALKDAPAIIEVGRAVHNYKEPKSLNYIIESLAGSGIISPTRVLQALYGLAIVAQRKEDKIMDDGQNVFYVYKNISLYEFAKIATGQDYPNVQEMQEIALALNLIGVIRIGHDEDRIVDYTKYTDADGVERYKPKIQRYRHYTQMGNVPNYTYRINPDTGKVEEDGQFILYVHRIVKTGRRAETTIEIGNPKKKPKPIPIVQPVSHLVDTKEMDTARHLFPGEDGLRFYNLLLSQSKIMEKEAIERVFNYYGRLQEAQARGDKIKADAEARIKADDTLDDEAVAKIREDALGRAIAEEVRELKNQAAHRSRDRKRLYTWYDLAAANKIIKTPYKVLEAQRAAYDYKKPEKYIAWERYKAKTKQETTKQ